MKCRLVKKKLSNSFNLEFQSLFRQFSALKSNDQYYGAIVEHLR